LDEEAALKKARYLVLRLLTYRARSRKEVEEYLERKGFSDQLSESVIKEMEKYGYIDDERFAKDFTSYRKLRGFGLKKIRYELYLKGIDSQIIDQTIDEQFDPEDDKSRIKEILEKRNHNKLTEDQRDERWFRREAAFLQRRGFQDNLIMAALKEYDHSE